MRLAALAGVLLLTITPGQDDIDPLHNCSAVNVPSGVERWRELVSRHFSPAEVQRALCVIRYESDGDPSAAFDEWTYWWNQHPDQLHLSDWPRPPRDTVLGRGGDSQWSVGLFQINVGNLAGNRIAGLTEWEPPRSLGVLGPWPDPRFSIEDAHKLLLDPENNVSAAAAIQKAEGWLPAWEADRIKCGLT